MIIRRHRRVRARPRISPDLERTLLWLVLIVLGTLCLIISNCGCSRPLAWGHVFEEIR